MPMSTGTHTAQVPPVDVTSGPLFSEGEASSEHLTSRVKCGAGTSASSASIASPAKVPLSKKPDLENLFNTGGMTRCVRNVTQPVTSRARDAKRDGLEVDPEVEEQLRGMKLDAFARDRAQKEQEEDDEAERIVAQMFARKARKV